MNRQSLIALLERYAPYDERDQAGAAQIIQLLKNEPHCFERSCFSVGHITSSAWIVDLQAKQVLLNHHRKLGRWLHFGGHADGDENAIRVAMREAEEESGFTQLELLSPDLFDVDVHLIPALKGEPPHYHHDLRFIFSQSSAETPTVSNESVELRWVAVDEVATYNNEPSMLRMLAKTATYLTRAAAA